MSRNGHRGLSTRLDELERLVAAQLHQPDSEERPGRPRSLIPIINLGLQYVDGDLDRLLDRLDKRIFGGSAREQIRAWWLSLSPEEIAEACERERQRFRQAARGSA